MGIFPENSLTLLKWIVELYFCDYVKSIFLIFNKINVISCVWNKRNVMISKHFNFQISTEISFCRSMNQYWVSYFYFLLLLLLIIIIIYCLLGILGKNLVSKSHFFFFFLNLIIYLRIFILYQWCIKWEIKL